MSFTFNLPTKTLGLAAAGLLITVLVLSTASAQSPELRKLDQFDHDMKQILRELMREHAESNAPSPHDRPMRKLTPEQFDEFQLKFFERFHVPQQLHVEASQPEAAIVDPVESIRDRRVGLYEKQHEQHLRIYRPIVKTARLSTVAIKIGQKQVALGTVVDADGSIVTKASELADADAVTCIFSNGSEYQAKLTGVDTEYDLALLAIDRVKTIPVRWSESGQDIGNSVVTADQSGKPLNVGVISVEPRSLVGTNLAFLGVGPGPHDIGVEILNVERETAAAKAGLQVGDVILSLSDMKTSSVDSLVNAIRAHKPGTKVKIEYQRNGKRQSTEAILDSASMPGDRELRMGLMNRMGSILSERNNEFPWVFQHDSPLLPEQCGGPLLDLDGNALGINIARGGRVDSYAIPADRIDEIVRKLKAQRN